MRSRLPECSAFPTVPAYRIDGTRPVHRIYTLEELCRTVGAVTEYGMLRMPPFGSEARGDNRPDCGFCIAASSLYEMERGQRPP